MSDTIFSGTSRYSTDFQAVISRSMAIASLHLNQLTSGQAALDKQSAALSTLQTRFDALRSAIDQLETAIGSGAYRVSVGDPDTLSASVGDGINEGSYSVEVLSLGAQSTTVSKNGLVTVTNPDAANIAAATSYTLTVGGTTKTITLGSATLTALVESINAADAGVEATAVNVGTTAAPDYRLSLRSTAYDSVAISLLDGAAELMDAPMPGASKASYKVNGITVESTSRTVTLAPGLTITLLGESVSGAETVTVTRSATAAGNALDDLASAYNAALDALDQHRGNGGGALTGDAILMTLHEALRALTHYDAASGDITSLTALGLEFDRDGKLALDRTAFDEAVDGNFSGLAAFLGSSSSGFLKSAIDTLDSVADETGGAIESASASVEDAIELQKQRVEAEQDWLALYESQLTERINQADALIAALEQKVTYYTGLFESMRIAQETFK